MARMKMIIRCKGILILVFEGEGRKKRGMVGIVPEGEALLLYFSCLFVPILALYNSRQIIL